jgi:TRAP-type C4-dicarboxylate transport system permease small subunit
VSDAPGDPLPFLLSGGSFFVALAVVVGSGLAVHAVLLRRLGAARLDVWTRRIESALFSIILATMLLFSFLQVILRNFFHKGILWFDPLVRTLVLWVAFLGALVATSNARHLHIDVIRRMMSESTSRRTGRILSTIAAVCCAMMANGASIYLAEEQLHGVSPFLGVPSWAAQSILLWGFAMLCYRFLVQAIWPTVVKGPHDEGPSVMKKSSDIDAGLLADDAAAPGAGAGGGR